MAAIETWFALGAIGMALGTAVLAYGYRLVPQKLWQRYSILVAVPLIAVGAYALMALDLSAIEAQTGSTVYTARYVDWLLTTPLHVLYLGLLAGAAAGVIYRAIGLMAVTIVLGFAGAVLSGPAGWAAFLAGSAAFAGVVYYAFRRFDAAATGQDDATIAVFRKLRAFVVVLWLIYPVIWVFAPAGVGLMNLTTTALVVSYLDVVAKVGFGLIALSGQLTSSAVTSESASPAD
jgi:sensory rhodopsin